MTKPQLSAFAKAMRLANADSADHQPRITMYHQLQPIGEKGIVAEIEYTIGDPDDEIPTITKITIGEAVIPVGAFDLTQIEDMADKLLAGHEAVMQGLIEEYLIDHWKENQNDR